MKSALYHYIMPSLAAPKETGCFLECWIVQTVKEEKHDNNNNNNNSHYWVFYESLPTYRLKKPTHCIWKMPSLDRDNSHKNWKAFISKFQKK